MWRRKHERPPSPHLCTGYSKYPPPLRKAYVTIGAYGKRMDVRIIHHASVLFIKPPVFYMLQFQMAFIFGKESVVTNDPPTPMSVMP